MSTRPTRRARLAVAVALGGASALYVYASAHFVGYTVRDLDQLWYAARAVRGGLDPYSVVGIDPAYPSGYHLVYPLTAVLLAVPLSWLTLEAARAVFVGLSCAVLGYALTRDSYLRLIACASGAYLMAVWSAQWSPLLTAAFLIPWLGFALAAKPTVGAALFVTRPSRAALVGALVLVLLSFVVTPTWLQGWLASLGTVGHIRAPITHPLGLLLALSLLRWRRPEARLLLTMACVPQNAAVYELMPLFLVPEGRRQLLVLAILSHCVLIAQMGFFYDYDRGIPITLMYLPALVMVLRRPNTGTVPAAIERLLTGAGTAVRRYAAAKRA